MKTNHSKFVVDGFERLIQSPWYRERRAAIEAQVRTQHAAELAEATGYWERFAIQRKISREIGRRLDGLGSPYSLWLRG